MEKSTELLLANLVLPIVKDYVIPKIATVISNLSNSNITQESLEDNFERYLAQRYEHFLIIDTLVFPNKQTLFKEIYEPLTVTDGNKYEEGNEILIDNYPDTFIPEYCRVVIEDTAGMGKSTVAKKLFIAAIEQNAGIPVLIELRQLNSKNRILKEIQKQLSLIGKTINQDVILRLINEGDFIFLFDGFDEIANKDRDFVIKELHSFIEKANHNYFLITSRTEDSLVSFGDFIKFRIRDLYKEEAYRLIMRYDSYSYKPIGNDLINELEKSNQESLSEYLTNPLLVSLLYKAYDHKKDIPVKKSQFYGQVYDALFEKHDLSKEGYLKRDKFTQLHTDDFERVLRYIGYFTAIENAVEYDKNYILNVIDKTKEYLPNLKFKASDFLKDLLNTVPLFKKEGNNYRWSHKSLQDYFAAKFIWIEAKGLQVKILHKIFNSGDNSRFFNILDIYSELDPITFDSTITKWLLEDFVLFVNSIKKELNKLPKLKRQRSIENLYNRKVKILVTKQEDYDYLTSDNSEMNHAVFSYYDKKVNFNYDLDYISFHYFKNPNILVKTYVSSNNNIETILRILSKIKPNLVQFKVAPHHHESLGLLKEDNVYEIDSKSVHLNNPDNVDLVNDLIQSSYTISYDEAFKVLRTINNSPKIALSLDNW